MLMRGWLTDTMSLTAKLQRHCGHFRVQRLAQSNNACLPDERALLGLPRRLQVQAREVLLRCDGRPVVYAHTVVPLSASAADWPFFRRLGERSLGSTLFGDPRVRRGSLQYARLHSRHPLARRAAAALGTPLDAPLLARRCLYRRRRGLLLVTELFLPAIVALRLQRQAGPDLLNAA
ncbi:MAG TPA: chorismate lyase [Noviherbaspirillum sp.]|uniref:chorismate--pyruvate lyase family protein n=1 Tax=Noviherbaspirillum sp. TaxID=1926288 RepID=UPI002F92BB60